MTPEQIIDVARDIRHKTTQRGSHEVGAQVARLSEIVEALARLIAERK